VYRYAEDCEVMLVAWAVDDGPVRVDEGITPEFKTVFLGATGVVAHNAQFDRTVLAAHDLERDVSAWRCTMARAMAHSLPGSLDSLCTLLGVPLEHAKLKDGKQLVQLFCKPRPKNMKLRRATKDTHPAEWARFRQYAANDVEAMREVAKRMPEWNYRGAELDLWHLDQRINDRGVRVDVAFSKAAVAEMARMKVDMDAEVAAATEGDVTAATQRDKLLQHILREHGVTLPDMRSATLERRLNDESLPDAVRQLIALRLESALTSGKKHKAVLGAVCHDGRLRGLLQFCGAARTGRWAGRIVQPQNLTRPPTYLAGEAYDEAITAIKAHATDLYPAPMEVISATVRGVFVAAPCHKLVVADLSAIEARVLAWLAGEQSVLDTFASGRDVYKAAYSASFGVPYEDATKEQRQIGKVQVLALGYQGAVGAVRAMAGQAAEAWSDEFIVNTIVRPWREAHSHIRQLWYDLEDAVRRAIAHPGHTYTVGRLKVRRDANWLRIRLPSGRYLCYPHPRVEDDTVIYDGTNQYTRKWGPIQS
jgi:DNA polymerase